MFVFRGGGTPGRRPARGRAWIVCVVLLAASAAAAQEEASQAALAEDFRSGDHRRTHAALDAYLLIPLEQRSPDLRRALADVVIREMRRAPRERQLGWWGREKLVAAVEEIARAGDTLAIPALVRFPRTGRLFPLGGRGVYEALLGLGKPALLGVVAALASEELREEARGPALRALAYFVAEQGAGALDRETRAAVRGHVVSALERPFPADSSPSAPMTPVATLVSAVQLGLLLDDAGVRATIAELAASADAVRARGITNPRWIARVRQSAGGGLADARPWRPGDTAPERDFRSEDGWRVMEALEAYRRIAPGLPEFDRSRAEAGSPALREALVDAVVREARRAPEERVLDDEYQLAELLADVAFIAWAGDTVAVRALALFPRSNARDVYGLAQRYDPAWDGPEPEFMLAGSWRMESIEVLRQLGEPALRGVLRTLTRALSEIGDAQYGVALETLAHLVADLDASAINDDVRATIIDCTIRALERPFLAESSSERAKVRVLESAIAIGVLLDDPVVGALVEELARSEGAVRARGIAEPVLVGWVRRTAREALANPSPRFARR